MTQGAGQGPDVWHGGAARGAGHLQPMRPVRLTPEDVSEPVPVSSVPAQVPDQVPAQEQVQAVPVVPAVPAVPAQERVPAPAQVPAPVPVPARTPAQAAPVGPPVTWAASVPPTPPTPPGAQATSPSDTPAAPEPEGEPSQEYTPTQRDLPVIGGTAATPEPTLVDVPSPVATTHEGDGPLYVVGDVHGYLDQLRTELREAGIIDAEDHWIAGDTRIWFLGDFTDRGPDGIGVIDLVMQLSAEAAAAGGYCKALMGNHELLLIGAKRFGDTPVNSGAGTASFQAAWLLNGGQRTDMERLQDHHIQWMSRLDAMALADGHLLVHSDATCYLEYGDTIEAVNDAVTQALQRNDADETWDLFRKFTKRFAFRDEESGVPAVREFLGAFGGKRVVHGHSPIPYLLGEVGGEAGDDEEAPPHVTGPHVYADGMAVAMDGGVTMAGKLLVTQLPLAE